MLLNRRGRIWGNSGKPAAGTGRRLLLVFATALIQCGCSDLNICVDESGVRGNPSYSYSTYDMGVVSSDEIDPAPVNATAQQTQQQNGAANGTTAAPNSSPAGTNKPAPTAGARLAAAPPSDMIQADKVPTTPLRPGTSDGGSQDVSMTQTAAEQLNTAATPPIPTAPQIPPSPPPAPAAPTGQTYPAASDPAMTGQVCYDPYAPADVSFGSWAMSFMRKFSVDNSQAEARELAEACQSNPCEQPSFAEIRKAKADALAAEEAKATGGDLMIKPDGSASDPTQVKFVSAPGALAMRLRAASDLNEIDGVPHALILVVYHLSDRTVFDQLAATDDGIRKLLEGVPFDASVKSTRQIFVQPGLEGDLIMERAEDGRFVAMVAGFNHPNASSSVFVTSYGIGSYAVNNGLLRKSTNIYTPRPINLDISLGKSNMSVSNTNEIFDNVKIATRM